MEIEDVRSDLHALKKLYGLLQLEGNNNDFQKPDFQNLDEKAKLILKRLLDGATEEAFNYHSKIIGEQSKDPPKMHSSTSALDSAWNASTCHLITSQSKKRCRTCERSGLKRMNSAKEKTPSNNISQSCDRGDRHRYNFDHYHHRNEITSGPINEFESKKAKESENNKKPMQKSFREIQFNSSIVRSPRDVATSQAMWVRSESNEKKEKSEKVVEVLEEEVANAIQRIEARIPVDHQVLTRILFDPINEKNAWLAIMGPQQEIRGRPSRKSGPAEKIPSQKALKPTDTTSIMPDQVLLSQTRKPVIEKNGLPSQMKSQLSGKTKGTTLPHQMLSPTRKSIQKTRVPDRIPSQTSKPTRRRDELPSQVTSQKDGKGKVTSLIGRMASQKEGKNELPSEITGQKDGKDNVRAQTRKPVLERNDSMSQRRSQKIGTTKDTASPLPAQMLSQTKTKNQSIKETGASTQPVQTRTLGPPPTHVRDDSVDPHTKNYRMSPIKELRPSKMNQNKKDQLPRQIRTLPTLLDQKPRQAKLGSIQDKDLSHQARSGTYRNARLGPLNKHLPHKAKAQETISTSSPSSSSWTTQETSSSESEWDRQQGKMLTQHRMGPTSQNRSSHVGLRSKDRRTNMGHEERIEENDHRSTTNPFSMVHLPRRVSSRTITRTNHEKKIGRLRRFKNKLAIIFHHHHHHHHHHHRDDGGDSELGHGTSPNHDRSFWRHLRKIIHRTSKDDHGKYVAEIYGERTAENFRKPTTRNSPRQHQNGYLHALLEGLVRHVWHSRKSKPSKCEMKRLGKSHSRKKKVVKKWHWWQNFHKRGGVIKRANSGKPRVRLGFKTKRPQLQAG